MTWHAHNRLKERGIPLSQVKTAIKRGNKKAGQRGRWTYSLDGLVVVLCPKNKVVITAYY